jgi:hypothetical protein
MNPRIPEDRRFALLGYGLTIAWIVWYTLAAPRGLCDENGHMEVIFHLWAKQPGFPDFMPMLPGYHFAVLSLSPKVPSFTSARLVSGAASLFLLFVADAILCLERRRMAGLTVALLAVLPILQPYTALAYTDALSTALVFCVWWSHRAGRPWLAGLSLALASFVRQTNVLWGALVLAHAGGEAWREGKRGREWLGHVLRAGRGIVVVWIVAAGTILITRRVTLGSTHGNGVQANPAVLHFGGCLLALLSVPWWPRLARALWRAGKTPARRTVWVIAGAATAAGLALSFSNPHVWNQVLFWPDTPFTLLRNWPLVWMQEHAVARWISSGNLVVVTAALGVSVAKHPHRIELATILGCGLAILLTNGLVEPRYFLPALPLALLFVDMEGRPGKALLAWWLLLCLIHAPFVAAGLSLW